MTTKSRKSYDSKKKDESRECDNCEYSCIGKSSMRKHIIDKHTNCIQPKKCKMFDRTFTENIKLKRHIKNHHKAEYFE